MISDIQCQSLREAQCEMDVSSKNVLASFSGQLSLSEERLSQTPIACQRGSRRVRINPLKTIALIITRDVRPNKIARHAYVVGI